MAFGLLAAAAPNGLVLIVARAGVGLAFALLLGLSLAIINDVFAPERRSAAIALLITWKYVPETTRSARRLDLPGLALVAVALLGVIYRISLLENGLQAGTIVPIHLNFLTGGSTILFAFYLVTIRGDSPALRGLLLIPATVLQAVAATGSGRAAARFGDRAVLVTGLVLLLAGLMVLTSLGEDTPLLVLFTAIALNAIGGAVVQTPQSTIMMASAPAHSGARCPR